MKKSALLCLIIMVVMLVSCTQQEQLQVTEWKPAPTTEAQTETATEQKVKVVKVKVETEPADKKNKKETKPPTEPSEPPTQGVVKPGRHIQVTTVKGSLNPKDFYFVYGSATVKLNDTIEAIYESLGEEDSLKELGKGKKQYTYSDFILTTYTDKKGQERLEEVVITEDSWSTAKGATVGYYGTALRRIYGDPVSNKKGVITYRSGANNLIFTVEDNLVTGISLKYIP